MLRKTITSTSLIVSVALSSCVAPDYDLPQVKGTPTVRTIEQRIVCELVDLVRTERRKNDPPKWHQYDDILGFTKGQYQLVADLSLTVTDTGELAPGFNFIHNAFSFNAGLKYSRKREQNFAETLVFSVPDLQNRWKADHSFGECPPYADTNLAGNLGIENMVTLAMTTNHLDLDKKTFGGYIEFDVVQNVNAVGPNWKLVTFEGPGGLGTLSREYGDRLTLAFAPAATPTGKPVVEQATSNARDFLNQLILNRIGNVLSR